MNADFYTGIDKHMVWIGSLKDHDGWPGDDVLRAPSVLAYETAVRELLRLSPSGVLVDGGRPDNGWPWSYPDSSRTKYVYTYAHCFLWISTYGSRFFSVDPWRMSRPDFQHLWSALGHERAQGMVVDGKHEGRFPHMLNSTAIVGHFDARQLHTGE